MISVAEGDTAKWHPSDIVGEKDGRGHDHVLHVHVGRANKGRYSEARDRGLENSNGPRSRKGKCEIASSPRGQVVASTEVWWLFIPWGDEILSCLVAQ